MVKRLDSGELCFMFLLVDDLFEAGTQQGCDPVIRVVHGNCSGRDLVEASWLLGMSVKLDMSAKTIELSQDRIIGSGLEQCRLKKSSTLPMDPKSGVIPDSHEKARRRLEREVSVIDDGTVLEWLHCKLAMFDSAGMYVMIRGSMPQPVLQWKAIYTCISAQCSRGPPLWMHLVITTHCAVHISLLGHNEVLSPRRTQHAKT
jgi:hypothetical protein